MYCSASASLKICVLRLQLHALTCTSLGPSIQSTQKGRDTSAIGND